MFGNRERRRKEKRLMCFFFLCLDCNEIENEKKIYVSFYFYTHINVFFLFFYFLWIYPYKYKRYIKVMGKYVTSCHIMLCMWVLLFKNHSLPSIPPNLGSLQRTKYFSNFSYISFFGVNFKNLTV